MSNTTPSQREKIWFRISQDEDGYPPVSVETLWMSPVTGGAYRLDNIPFFAKGVSCGDMVSAFPGPDGHLWFDQVVDHSGHSTLRVVVFREVDDKRPLEERVEELRGRFSSIGCSTELSHLPGLLAVDVPPLVNFSIVLPLLEEGVMGGWDYEEANLSHPA